MYFQYGDYIHPAGEVNLVRFDVHMRPSPRNMRASTVFRMHLEGMFRGDTQAEIHARVTALVNAYATDYHDATLYHDDGTPTQYQLLDSHPAAITGVRVIERSWPRGGPVEYATQRTFSVTLESELDESPSTSQCLDWHEELKFVGNTGPLWEMVRFPHIKPRRVDICDFTEMRITQRGYSLGSVGYILPFGALWPDWEHKDQRVLIPTTPKFQGKAHRYYRMDWAYFMELPDYTEGTPTLFPG